MKKQKIIIGVIGIIVVGVLLFLYETSFKTYSVVFNTQMGAGYKTQNVKVGGTATNPGTPSAAGYKFTGWYLDDHEYDFNTKVTKNITITAHWEKE